MIPKWASELLKKGPGHLFTYQDFGLKPPAYADVVFNYTLDIFMELRRVSEKSYSAIDDLTAELKPLFERAEIRATINLFERRHAREKFCAEVIFASLRNEGLLTKDEEKSDPHSLNPHPEDEDDGW